MALTTWLAFVAAALVLTMTPGPSILLGVVHSLNFGAKKTVFTALGDISANFIQMMLVAAGLGVVIANSAGAFHIIKWFGVATLIVMGIRMIMSKPAEISPGRFSSEISPLRMYVNGFLVAAGNPKAIVFFTAFFPQFIDPARPVLRQMAVMCPTMATLDFSWVMIYAISAHRFSTLLRTRPNIMGRIGGSALIGASGLLALSNK